MKIFTNEQIDIALGKLSLTLRDYLSSEQSNDMLMDIAIANHLDNEKQMVLSSTVAHTIIGLLHPDDLAKELADRLRVEKRIADGLEKEIRIKILYPIAEDLRITHGFHIEGAPTQKLTSQPTQQITASLPVLPGIESVVVSQTPTPQKQEEIILKPHVQKEEFPVEPLVSPLVLHEHEDIETAHGATNYTDNLARPSFHVSENYGTRVGGYEEPAPAARLELGAQVEPGAYVEPKTTRVGREEAKIVHYSAPDAQTDPFSRMSESTARPVQDSTPQSPKPSVPQSNVVNLKDLPK
jgi:hypothetical protein